MIWFIINITILPAKKTLRYCSTIAWGLLIKQVSNIYTALSYLVILFFGSHNDDSRNTFESLCLIKYDSFRRKGQGIKNLFKIPRKCSIYWLFSAIHERWWNFLHLHVIKKRVKNKIKPCMTDYNHKLYINIFLKWRYLPVFNKSRFLLDIAKNYKFM